MAGSTDRALSLVALCHARRRAFNDRLSQLDCALPAGSARLFRCECGLIGCASTIKLSADDYAAIRATRRQFAVRADHVIAEAETVVATNPGYVIVENPNDAAICVPDSGSRPTDFSHLGAGWQVDQEPPRS